MSDIPPQDTPPAEDPAFQDLYDELETIVEAINYIGETLVSLSDRVSALEPDAVTASVRYRIEQTDDNCFIVVDTTNEAQDVDIFDTEDEAQEFVRTAAIGDMAIPTTDIPTKIAGLESRVAELESLVASMMTHEMTVTDITPEGAY